MTEYHIKGGYPLCGQIKISGAKNSVLPVMAASVMTVGESELIRCPDIADVEAMAGIIESLGCCVKREADRIVINAGCMNSCSVPDGLMGKMRSSVLMTGPLLARCGKAVISKPGGCCIGKRPVDIHIAAFRQMGAAVSEENGKTVITAEKLHGSNITLAYPSVGATENIMMAATAASGETVIHNCAREPEIIDLQNYLRKCGAQITGAGSQKIIIKGGRKLHGCSYEIIPDRIEAGTYLMAAAGTGGEIETTGIPAELIKPCIKVLRFSGCTVRKTGSGIWLKAPERLYCVGKFRTGPYPAFPTDLHPQLAAIMARAYGNTYLEETVFEDRFAYTKQLIKMGADIEISNRVAIIKGKNFLSGAVVDACDLRGGAALVIAGLAANGNTAVRDTGYIERGYSSFHSKLNSLGAKIDRCI